MIHAGKLHRPYELPVTVPTTLHASAWAAGSATAAKARQDRPVESSTGELLATVRKACEDAVSNAQGGRSSSPSHGTSSKRFSDNIMHVCDALRREGARGLLRTQAKNLPAAIVTGGVLRFLPPAMGVGEEA